MELNSRCAANDELADNYSREVWGKENYLAYVLLITTLTSI